MRFVRLDRRIMMLEFYEYIFAFILNRQCNCGFNLIWVECPAKVLFPQICDFLIRKHWLPIWDTYKSVLGRADLTFEGLTEPKVDMTSPK